MYQLFKEKILNIYEDRIKNIHIYTTLHTLKVFRVDKTLFFSLKNYSHFERGSEVNVYILGTCFGDTLEGKVFYTHPLREGRNL